MRGLMFSFVGSAGILASAGLAFSLAAPAPMKFASISTPPAAIAGSAESGVSEFPNCPAPAVNGMNIRAAKTADGYRLTVFVVVQNVGHRAFFANAGSANLTVSIGDKALGTFPVEKLAASEVRFYSVETALPRDAATADLVASLDFSTGTRIGRVEGTLDCQTSDNRSVRRSRSLQASLERAAG